MTQLVQERIDGDKARLVLDSPIFKQAWKDAEDSIVSQMVEARMRDTEIHTRLVVALQILNHVRRHIEMTMETGQMADIQLEEPNKIARFFGR